MIKKLEGILRLAILCLGVYLVYTLYRPQADRLIREVKEQVFTTTENPAALLTEERQEETEAQKTLSFPARWRLSPHWRRRCSLRSTFVFRRIICRCRTVMRKARMTAGPTR